MIFISITVVITLYIYTSKTIQENYNDLSRHSSCEGNLRVTGWPDFTEKCPTLPSEFELKKSLPVGERQKLRQTEHSESFLY
jgi:hypothetical protein